MAGPVSNITALQSDATSHFLWYTLFLVLAFIGNTLALIVIHRQRELQEAMNTLYKLLAGLNLMHGIFGNIWSICWFSFPDPSTCKTTNMFLPFIYRLSTTSTAACLCGISFTMYILVRKPLHYNNIVTRTRLKIAVLLYCTIGVPLCAPFLPWPSLPFYDIYVKLCLRLDLQPDDTKYNSIEEALLLAPIAFMIVFTSVNNIILLKIAWKWNNVTGPTLPDSKGVPCLKVIELNKHQSSGMQHQKCEEHATKGEDTSVCLGQMQRPYRVRGIVTVVLLTTSVFVTWLPLFIYYAIDGQANDHISDKLSVSCTWIQPLVYFMTNGEARKILRNLLHTRAPSIP